MKRTTHTGVSQAAGNKHTVTIKAKRKLKSHLSRYKHEEDFEVTEKRVAYWWGVINKAVFGGKLPKPAAYYLSTLRDCWGACEPSDSYNNVNIHISNSIDSRDLFLATVAHEMVHQWQFITEHKMSHAASYLKWKRYFKKHYNIVL